MIVKTNKGYVVKSEGGKVLSRPYPTKQQATRRLAQIEYYKGRKGK